MQFTPLTLLKNHFSHLKSLNFFFFLKRFKKFDFDHFNPVSLLFSPLSLKMIILAQ